MAPSVTGSTLASRPQNRHTHHPHVKLQNGAKAGSQNTGYKPDFDFAARKADVPAAATSSVDRQGYFLATGRSHSSDKEQKAVIYFEDIRTANAGVDGDKIDDGVGHDEPMRHDIHYVEPVKDTLPWEGVENFAGNRKVNPNGTYFHWTIKSDRAAGDFKVGEPVGIAVDQDRSYRVYKANDRRSLFVKTLTDNEQYTFWPDYYCVDENNLPGYPDDVYLCLTYKNNEGQVLGRGVAWYQKGEDASSGAQPSVFDWVDQPNALIIMNLSGDAWASKLLDSPVLDNFECCISSNANGARKNALVGEATRGDHQGFYVYKDTAPAPGKPTVVLHEYENPSNQFQMYTEYWCAATEREIDGGPFS
ncbi:hypothetical protein LTR95_000829 [Oleoguttula sp. CCFEE 5521]